MLSVDDLDEVPRTTLLLLLGCQYTSTTTTTTTQLVICCRVFSRVRTWKLLELPAKIKSTAKFVDKKREDLN